MQTETGEIKDYEKIKAEVAAGRDQIEKWSEPFSLGEVVDFKGVKMKIVRIKKQRGELHLRHVSRE